MSESISRLQRVHCRPGSHMICSLFAAVHSLVIALHRVLRWGPRGQQGYVTSSSEWGLREPGSAGGIGVGGRSWLQASLGKVALDVGPAQTGQAERPGKLSGDRGWEVREGGPHRPPGHPTGRRLAIGKGPQGVPLLRRVKGHSGSCPVNQGGEAGPTLAWEPREVSPT